MEVDRGILPALVTQLTSRSTARRIGTVGIIRWGSRGAWCVRVCVCACVVRGGGAGSRRWGACSIPSATARFPPLPLVPARAVAPPAPWLVAAALRCGRNCCFEQHRLSYLLSAPLALITNLGGLLVGPEPFEEVVRASAAGASKNKKKEKAGSGAGREAEGGVGVCCVAAGHPAVRFRRCYPPPLPTCAVFFARGSRVCVKLGGGYGGGYGGGGEGGKSGCVPRGGRRPTLCCGGRLCARASRPPLLRFVYLPVTRGTGRAAHARRVDPASGVGRP
jgi:hypothetical protein